MLCMMPCDSVVLASQCVHFLAAYAKVCSAQSVFAVHYSMHVSYHSLMVCSVWGFMPYLHAVPELDAVGVLRIRTV